MQFWFNFRAKWKWKINSLAGCLLDFVSSSNSCSHAHKITTFYAQLIAGVSKPTSGSICIQKYRDDGSPHQSPILSTPERVGIVFQFPERYEC